METAVTTAATIVIPALARVLARARLFVSMRRARPGPTTISRPGLAATSCSKQRTTTRCAGATTRGSATRPWPASAPMAKPFTSATSGSLTTMLAPSITRGASTIGDKPAPPAGRRTQSVTQLGGAVVAVGPHTLDPEVQAVRNRQSSAAALCVVEKDPAWLGL